jgi:hypothetical protein
MRTGDVTLKLLTLSLGQDLVKGPAFDCKVELMLYVKFPAVQHMLHGLFTVERERSFLVTIPW